jgi:glycosyltransferase involved in cell wall biosynthesis
MRIAWVTTGFSKDENDYGGAAAIHNLARELSKANDIELTIFSLYHPLNQPEYNFYKARVFSLAEKGFESRAVKLKIWRNCQRKFAREHSINKFDVIHSMWAGESGYVASKLSKSFGVPLIINICGGELARIKEIGYGSMLKYWQKRFVDTSFASADKIISGSEYITEKIKEFYKNDILSKVVELPFGMDENVFFPSKKRRTFKEQPVLINVGSAVTVKSHITLFNALTIVIKKFPELILIHCGLDNRGILLKMAEEFELQSNVKLMGFLPYEEMPKIMNQADIFVSSSLYESQNMALIEAAFCGLSLVSTDVGAAREVTDNIVKPGDHILLANKIIEVMENLDKEKDKAKHKLDVIRLKYSLVNTAKRFVELYNFLGSLK